MILGSSFIRALTETDIGPLGEMVAAAFAGQDGAVPARYRPAAIRRRLQWSLESAADGGPVTLVATLAGCPVALGQYGPSRWAGGSWELMLGVTRPDLQGKGIGHALVLARMAAIEAAGGGLVFVSAKRPERWLRYGFQSGPFNPQTGATALWRYVGGGR